MVDRPMNRAACHGASDHLAGVPKPSDLLAIVLALCCPGCAHGPNKVLRERCAQLANRGYSDRAELVALLAANGQATGGGEQALRQAAKQLCITHL